MTIFFIIAMGLAVANTVWEMRRQLTMLQQNSYRNERYRRWMRESGMSTTTLRLLSIAVVLVSLSVTLSTPVVAMALVALLSLINLVNTCSIHYKKPLVMTRRAWRIFATQLLLCCAVTAVAALLFEGNTLFVIAVTALALYCGSPLVTMAANWLLKPVERHINNRYINDAAHILSAMPDLKIIGVTGSYGKTSTKHYLYRILSEHFDTMMTPGSFNTTMGVVRTVREMLKPYNEVFIVEMGAKQRGDIEEICRLVHPQIGIVTAVGEQHLESFKTIENVQSTKFELVDSLPVDGLAVVNNDFPKIADRPVENVACVRYGINNAEADVRVTDIEYTPQGTSFTLTDREDRTASYRTRLVGECNISNIAAAIIVARALGVPEHKIRYAVEQIEQVEHRLMVKRTPGGVTIIDDAYNSNPIGSAMALDVLKGMKTGKRIIVTPGMIELGERQYELNRQLGRKIAEAADIAIIVNEYNREAIVKGCKEGKMDDVKIRTVDSFAQAQQLLATMLSAGDTVLYENDLPDTFK